MKLKGPTSGTQGAKGNRLSHFEIVGDDPCADKSPFRKQPQIAAERRVPFDVNQAQFQTSARCTLGKPSAAAEKTTIECSGPVRGQTRSASPADL